MQSDHGAVSLTGRRSNNEDAMLCLPRHGVFAVSDGMGGLDAGEVASQMAIESLQEALPRIDKLRSHLVRGGSSSGHKVALADLLDDLFQETTATIHRHGISRSMRLGATLTTGILISGSLFITHVGDSRLYIIRGGKAAPLTEDHSVAALRLRPHRRRHRCPHGCPGRLLLLLLLLFLAGGSLGRRWVDVWRWW